MRILLTGGTGSVGHAVVERLSRGGHSILVIGRRESMQVEGAQYQACDINDYAQLREVVRGCDLIVHLAALPSPGSGSPEEVFRVNCQGTFNVFQSAAEEGIGKVIQASSINATGQFFGLKPAPLHYLPIDEDHPTFSTDAYSFSKNVIEEIGEYFYRREGINSAAFRLPYVAAADYHETARQNRQRVQAVVEKLLQKSPQERRAWFDSAWELYNNFRAERPYEKQNFARPYMMSRPDDEREKLVSMMQRVNFFVHVDERDSAQAVEKAIQTDFTGSHALFINDHSNWTGVPSRTLAELFYPDVQEFRSPLEGTESLVSIRKAQSLIGYAPEYSFNAE